VAENRQLRSSGNDWFRGKELMRVLVLTNMYPSVEKPASGTFVRDQVESLRQEGVEVDVLVVDGSKHRMNYVWGIFRLWARLLHRRYDLIHAHYVFSGIIARAQFLRPVVLTHHGLEVFTTWQRVPSRLITPLVNRVIVVSEEQKRKLGFKNIQVIPCGIDLEFFKPVPREIARSRLGLAPERKLVVWAGNHLRPEKRFDIVEAAIALARQKDPAIELVLVSGKPHDVVPLYMSACDVLLLVSDAEGSPMVIKEAMACNLAIVSVPVGDVVDVIGETDGCYICRRDPVDVAEKLILALSRSERTSGRERVTHLDEPVIARRIIDVYRGAIGDMKAVSQTGLAPRRVGREL
jgi:glycosyltransferase involved in cell wall biosynthesis